MPLAGTPMTAVLQTDFLEALRLLARVFDGYEAKLGSRPVLVGGAAASIYTGGMITSGDFDVVAAADEIFDAVMAEHGFIREDRAGACSRVATTRSASPSFRSRTAGRSLWRRSRI
jgi:hypothetical protein